VLARRGRQLRLHDACRERDQRYLYVLVDGFHQLKGYRVDADAA